uniref:Uncharacterized protein n=1 Tax=Kalanchoe fedtschenkoi TaxID=63787 RepID=A0A7N0TVV8_KALFE
MPDSHHHQMASMYPSEAMSIGAQMENADALVDGGGGQFGDSGVGQFEHHQIEDEAARDGVLTGPVEAVPPHSMYPLPGADFGAGTGAGPNQLTLWFHGEAFVFEDVSAEKVQAVLLLLGGYEVPGGANTGAVPQNERSIGDMYGRETQQKRAAALSRFREKKKDRCFDKKIRYSVRKEVAHRMKRKKGQFVSSKASSEDMGSGSSDGNASPGAAKEEQETSCKNCGTSSKHTPMMRRGPEGPRTLCNACGLKWANKIVLGKCPGTQNPSMKAAIRVDQTGGEKNGPVAMPSITDLVCFTSTAQP